MSFALEFSEDFLIDIRNHQKAGNKSILKKIDSLLTEIRENPFEGRGKPERLKYFENAIWSRRINHKHRLVYELKSDHIEILSGWGHYSDK